MSIGGIPNLRTYTKSLTTTLLGNAINSLWDYFFSTKWGIYKTGTTTVAVEITGVGSAYIMGESTVATHPISTGAFYSYDKVKTPRLVRISLIKDGAASSRVELENWVETARQSTEIFDILTDTQTLISFTLKDYTFPKDLQTGYKCVADCVFQEVILASETYSSSNVSDPNLQSNSSSVKVQTKTATKTTSAAGASNYGNS